MPQWRAEARNQRREARAAFSPSMRQHIDIAALYHDALRGLPDSNDDLPPRLVPAECSVTLDEMLAER